MPISKAQTVLLVGLGSIPASAWALDGSVSAAYSSAFVTSDPIMTFGIIAQQPLAHDLKFSIRQSVNRNFVVDDSKDVWEWNDASLMLDRSYQHSADLKLGTRLSTTLPVSLESRHNELLMRPELRISASIKLPENFSSETAASYAYYWHKYDATRPEGQSDGGEALPQFTYAVGQSLTHTWDVFELGASGTYRVKRYFDLRTTEEGYIAAPNRLRQYSYTVGLFGTYHYSDKTSLTVAYEQGSGLERPGYDDFVIYDKEQSSWTLGVEQVW